MRAKMSAGQVRMSRARLACVKFGAQLARLVCVRYEMLMKSLAQISIKQHHRALG